MMNNISLFLSSNEKYYPPYLSNHVPIPVTYKNNKNNINNVTPPLMRNGKNSKRKKKAISSVFIVLQQHSNRNVTHRPDKKKYGSAKDEQTKRVYTMRVYIRIHIYTYTYTRTYIYVSRHPAALLLPRSRKVED